MNIKNIITSNPEVVGGTPVFKGSRVPVRILFEYIQGGKSINDFLEDFPTVNEGDAYGLMNEFVKEFIEVEAL